MFRTHLIIQIEIAVEKFIRDFVQLKKAKKLINYEPKYSLEYGIKAILEVGALYPDWATTEKNYIIDESL